MENENKMVSLRMDADLRKKIDEITKESGIKITYILQKGAEMFIAEYEEKKRILSGSTQYR